MDFGFLGTVEFTPQFFAQVLQITLIDLVLAGDNAVVIALAVQNLQGKQRKLGHHPGCGRGGPDSRDRHLCVRPAPAALSS